jgi:hypothetical protein
MINEMMCSADFEQKNIITKTATTNTTTKATSKENETRRQFWSKIMYLLSFVEKSASNLEENIIRKKREKYLLICRHRILRLFTQFRKYNSKKKVMIEKDQKRKISHLSLCTMNFSKTMRKFHSCDTIKGKENRTIIIEPFIVSDILLPF